MQMPVSLSATVSSMARSRTTQSPSAASPGVVICFGDSLTKGCRDGEDPAAAGCCAERSYPAILEGLLREAGRQISVLNAGNWGDTSHQLIARLPKVLSEGAKKGRLEAVLVLGGTNDILQGAASASVVGTLLRLHETAGNAVYMPRVGVFTLPPAKSTGSSEKTRLELNRRLREACQRPAPRWTPQGRQFLVDLESVDLSLAYDGIHFTAEGNAEIAKRAFKALQPLLTS